MEVAVLVLAMVVAVILVVVEVAVVLVVLVVVVVVAVVTVATMMMVTTTGPCVLPAWDALFPHIPVAPSLTSFMTPIGASSQRLSLTTPHKRAPPHLLAAPTLLSTSCYMSL